ncbi:hypothetical protein [Paraburkholderia terrae]
MTTPSDNFACAAIADALKSAADAVQVASKIAFPFSTSSLSCHHGCQSPRGVVGANARNALNMGTSFTASRSCKSMDLDLFLLFVEIVRRLQ